MRCNKFILIIFIIIALSIYFLYKLGKDIRVGYISDIELLLEDTLDINGFNYDNIFYRYNHIDFTNKYLIKDNNDIIKKIGTDDLKEYILTNLSITNYYYRFKFSYYNTIFKHSDIYGVYPDISLLSNNNYIKAIDLDENGSPFGYFISDVLFTDNKIDNINYTLKLKYNIYLYSIFLLILLLILVYLKNIKCFINIKLSIFFKNIKLIFICIKTNLYNKKYFLLFCFYSFLILILILSTFLLLGIPLRDGYLTNFKIDISKTMEYNNIKYQYHIDPSTSQSLITLNETNLHTNNVDFIEFIFTNNLITNYYYTFNIKSYNNFINNNFFDTFFIKEFYKYNNSNINFIHTESYGVKTNNLLSNKIFWFNSKEDISFYLKLDFNICIYIFLYIILLFFYYIIFISDFSYIKMNITIIIMTLLFFIFHLYISYPGFFRYWDNLSLISSAYNNNYWNGNVVFAQVTLSFLYSIFGFNSSYFFIINILTWYFGLLFIILSLYSRYRDKKIILLLFISFIGNIWTANNYQVKDITAINYLWLSLSLFFSFMFIGKKRSLLKFIILFFGILFFLFSMISRHNFIVTIYPICIFLSFLLLHRYSIGSFYRYVVLFLSLMIIFAVLLILIFKYQPNIWIKDDKVYSDFTQHLYYLPIAGIATISGDTNLIPNEMYKNNKSFIDLKELYISVDGVDADSFGWGNTSVIFIDGLKEKDLRILLLKSIIRHPFSYLKHILNYSKVLLSQKKGVIIMDTATFFRVYDIYGNPVYPKRHYIYKDVKFTERYISKNHASIFQFLYKKLLNINLFYIFIINILIFLILIVFIVIDYKLLQNNIWFIFTLSILLSSLSTFIIVSFFTPVPLVRYIYPVVPLTIFEIISFVCFLIEFKKNINV